MAETINVLLLQSDAPQPPSEAIGLLSREPFVLLSEPIDAGRRRLTQEHVDVVLLPIADEQLPQLTDILAAAPLIPVVTWGDEHLAHAAVAAGAEDHLVAGRFDPPAVALALQLAVTRRHRWVALADSEARLRALIEAQADGLIVVDGSGTVRFVNQAAENLLACRGDELVGSMIGTPAGHSGTVELAIVRAGTKEPVAAEMRVVEIEWHGKTGFVESIRDITQRKNEVERARDAIRMRDDFLATLSHELRNPLAALSSAADLLIAQHADNAVAAFPTEVIHRQTQHMVRLLDDLLDVARISQGKIELRKQCLPIDQVVHDAVLAVKPKIEATHRLSVSLPAEPLYIFADPSRIQQVLVNILTNAMKYTDVGGTIELTVARNGADLRVAVRDNGQGIEPQLLDTIFEPFVQIEQTLARSEGGLGIGLAVVRRLAELHGGWASAASDGAGRGSEFVVSLPLVAPEQGPQIAAPVHPLHSLRVVLIDDNEDVVRVLQRLLVLKGHSVSVATDGRAGLELILAELPDVALIDVGLPGLNGYEIAAQVASHQKASKVQLVAMTGYGQPEDRQHALEAGFRQHLTKPVTLLQLECCLAQVVATQT